MQPHWEEEESGTCVGAQGQPWEWAPVLWPHAPGLAAEEAVESRLPLYPGRGHS